MPNAKGAEALSKHKFLLLGDTGSGKTTQLLTFPGKKFAYLFDPNAILSLRGHDIEYEEFLPDQLNLSVKSLSKGKGDSTTSYQSDIYLRWEQDFDQRVKDGFFDDIDVISLDSITTLLDLIMDRTLSINGRAGHWPQQDDYGPQMITFINICRTLTSMDKTLIMTGHLELRQDDLSKKIVRQPVMTGKLKTKIPLLFSDIFICESDNDGQGHTSHKIQTVKDRQMTAVRSSFKPALEPFEDVTIDWDKPVEGQGLGGLVLWEQEQRGK